MAAVADEVAEMIYDFHTHSTLSDGSLSPMELIRRALVAGYKAIAITDHAGPGELERVIKETLVTCREAEAAWPIKAIPGVELTHVPPSLLQPLIRRARELGARLVAVHGETIVEPVEKGTNRAALLAGVDILAHPGLITPEEAMLAAERGVFLELSARRGHCLCNGHVLNLARRFGAPLLLNSDAHDPEDLLSPSLATNIVLGSGADGAKIILSRAPLALLNKLATRATLSSP